MEEELNIVFPKDWKDITLGKYQEVQKYFDSLKEEEEPNSIRVLSMLSDTPEDEIRLLPTRIVNEAVQSLSFLRELPNEQTEKRLYMEYEGERYNLPTVEELTFGEWVDLNNAMKSDRNDFASFFAILCRKDGEIYNQQYINQLFQKRVEIFKKMPMNEIHVGISFFEGFGDLLKRLSPNSINQIKDELSNIVKNIENSMKIGDYSPLSTFLLKKKLKRLKKSLNKI